MVYCGKPSKGCSNCRERKIRCDQRDPGCGQCEKRQQQCPGYRNLVDLMFRDESSHVIKKAKAKARKRGHLTIDSGLSPGSGSERGPSLTPEPRTAKSLSLVVPRMNRSSSPSNQSAWSCDDGSMLMSPESGSWPAMPAMALFYNLAPTCQYNGFAYFFSRYVAVEETACHQRFDFVYDIWKPSTLVPERQVDGVLASMTAVGLMGLASMTHSRDLMEAAQKSYGTALQLTNVALKDPVEAIKDTTMLSVLILGLFEMLSENTQRRRTVEAFQEHVNGAAALAKLRGPAQFRSRAGARMFSMLCQRVVISCVLKDEPMPPVLLDLWQEMSKTLDPTDPTAWVTPLICQALQVRHVIKKGAMTNPEIIVCTLLGIEADFETRTGQLSSSWDYRTFRVSRHHPAIFGGTCHLYPSSWQATVWNILRTVRILILETILAEIYNESQRYSSRLSSDYYIHEFNKAKRKLQRMVEAISASVPQHLGLIDPTDGSIENFGAASTPISSVEVRETPSPPTSPSARLSDAGSNSAQSPRESLDRQGPSGLTILDVTGAKDPEDEAGRIVLLVSATSTIVWPLYMVGMSSACTEQMKSYVVDRLRTLYMETGITQADAVANLIEEHETSREWLDGRWMEQTLLFAIYIL
ncbi:hypothetical protein B0H66DRAFT_577690 [Apodospora peruviana]|uniref:Zn(2)-C6 fungal-type domain-containing protein n=1 Tax=Apodospora peruviana TaxID=516989 RepID=A0AAE0M0N2_9PEZI|nr:hypothetical protein B0H66DRAFT_577690 [Apodospora peruviana]